MLTIEIEALRLKLPGDEDETMKGGYPMRALPGFATTFAASTTEPFTHPASAVLLRVD